jgi:predicted deacylase
MSDTDEPQNVERAVEDWRDQIVLPGESRDIQLAVSESYSGMDVRIPLHIRRAVESGPTVFVSAALHGNEINGTGAIHQLIDDAELQLRSGAIVFAPVLNILGFERHSRYLPDRRDLNRAFPGSEKGSLASRMARQIFATLPLRCDYGIDIHTAAVRRTNYPNIRGDLRDPAVRRIAEAFGCEIIMNSVGPKGSFRREACRAGCPTIVMEGGEVSKVEPAIVASSIRGIKNVLRELGMLAGQRERPDYQLILETSKWIRADRGGFLQFHIKPGDVINQGQPIATNSTLLGREQNVIYAPFDAVIIGMTTLPAVSPGEPICNLGRLPKGIKAAELLHKRAQETHGLEERLVEELGSNVLVVDRHK